MGGRLDHTLANLQTLAFIAERGGIGYLIGKGFTAAAVRNGTLCFPAGMTGTISVFALGEPARGVYLTGLYYPLTDATLTPVWPLGVSNAFTGKAAAVAVRTGEAGVNRQLRAFLTEFLAQEVVVGVVPLVRIAVWKGIRVPL